MRSLEYSHWALDLFEMRFVEQSMLPAPRWLVRQDESLPLRPLWPGFAINTVFYATILWLLTLAPFTARRMIRRKRGHCIKCGYDLSHAEHKVCPECGEELRARSKAPL